MRIQKELVFPSNLKNEPIICSVCKRFDVVIRIVEASFSTDTGWAILIFEGSETDIDKASEFLKNQGVVFEGMEEASE